MKKTVVGSGLAPLLLISASLWAEPQIELKPLNIGALQEFGSLGSGHFGGNPDEFHNEWVDHFGAFVTQTGKVTDELTFDIGLGGIFQIEKPENRNPFWGGTQYKDFFIGPTKADLVWTLGAKDDPNITLQFGLFPYKYSDASNLGEYLFRSGPYPTFLWTGGYAEINTAFMNLQGLRVGIGHIPNLSLDLFLTSETFLPPLYDFSPTLVAKYKVADGLFTVGGGVQFKRLIQVDGDKTTVKTRANAYFTDGGQTYSGKVDYYLNQKNFWDSRQAADLAANDTAAAARDAANSSNFAATVSRVKYLLDTAVVKPDLHYYTTAGTILMGTASLDFKKLFNASLFGKEDLKLYGEVALLGWTNYPVFYEKRSERMPMMIGFNLPGFKFLDQFSFEWEYFNSPWINSYKELGSSNGATPDFPSGSIDWTSQSNFNDVAKKDNTSWSLLAKKTIAHSITISGQVARDHVRMPSFQSWFGPGLDPNEALSTSKDWYWMLQFAVGI